MEKTKVFNVIILDKSGSMGSIRNATVSGVNEVINGIKVSQEKYQETQQHYILLNAFCSHGIDTVYNNVSISEAKEMTQSDYQPCCGTPLYDAMGLTLTKLEERLADVEDYMVSVTVVTDGYENASRNFSGRDIKELIERLKEKGWTFTYMGADHDVEKVAGDLSFDSHISFEHDDQCTGAVFESRNRTMQYEAMAMQELREREQNEGMRFSNEDRKNYRQIRVTELLENEKQNSGKAGEKQISDNQQENPQEQKQIKEKSFLKRIFSNE